MPWMGVPLAKYKHQALGKYAVKVQCSAAQGEWSHLVWVHSWNLMYSFSLEVSKCLQRMIKPRDVNLSQRSWVFDKPTATIWSDFKTLPDLSLKKRKKKRPACSRCCMALSAPRSQSDSITGTNFAPVLDALQIQYLPNRFKAGTASCSVVKLHESQMVESPVCCFRREAKGCTKNKSIHRRLIIKRDGNFMCYTSTPYEQVNNRYIWWASFTCLSPIRLWNRLRHSRHVWTPSLH